MKQTLYIANFADSATSDAMADDHDASDFDVTVLAAPQFHCVFTTFGPDEIARLFQIFRDDIEETLDDRDLGKIEFVTDGWSEAGPHGRRAAISWHAEYHSGGGEVELLGVITVQKVETEN